MNQDTFSEIAGMREELARLRIQVAEAEEDAHIHSKTVDEQRDTIARLRAENESLQSTIMDLRDRAGIACEDVLALRARIAELEALREWEPDWAKAPAWAQWYAMDSTGWCYWYQVEPEPKSVMGDWSARGRRHEPAKQIEHPGWLDTKRSRPQEAPAVPSPE